MDRNARIARITDAFNRLPIDDELRHAIEIHVLGEELTPVGALVSQFNVVTYKDNTGVVMHVYYNNTTDRIESKPATVEEAKMSMQNTHGDLAAEVYFGRPGDTSTAEHVLRRKEIKNAVDAAYSYNHDSRWLCFAAIIIFDLGIAVDQLTTDPASVLVAIEKARPGYNLNLQ
jgi:hypothetical protein